jgi:hypothetical protein
VHVRLVLLGRVHVRLADGEAVGRRRALLEGRLGAQGRAELVGVDADVLGHLCPGGYRGPAYGREEVLGDHGVFGMERQPFCFLKVWR